MQDARIELAGAAFGYRGKPIVSGVDLTIGPSDFLGVLGPNGSGKTTLFRGILGLLPALQGSVEHRGVRWGYVPQRDALDTVFPLTVRELVGMGALSEVDRWGRLLPAARDRVEALLHEVELGGRGGDAFGSLSGGQRQRALLARALVSRPNVLLLDEPTSGVDKPTQERVLELLRRLNTEEGLTILLVSHHLTSTLDVVRSVVWVDRGTAKLLEGEDARALSRVDTLFAGSGQGE